MLIETIYLYAMWRVTRKTLESLCNYHDVLPKNHQKSSWRHQEQTKDGRFSSIFLYDLVPVSDAGCWASHVIKSWGWSETLMLREAGTPQQKSWQDKHGNLRKCSQQSQLCQNWFWHILMIFIVFLMVWIPMISSFSPGPRFPTWQVGAFGSSSWCLEYPRPALRTQTWRKFSVNYTWGVMGIHCRMIWWWYPHHTTLIYII